ncbi:MAG: 50S ribosomal protein L10 [Candidatus Omnitrophica bacterium]|nr:50S ribosomal protein L10 [Candidatus Omnitrophota bacterium]
MSTDKITKSSEKKTTSLGRLCKERMIDEVLSLFKESPNFFVTSYMGSTVSDLEGLRRNLRGAKSSYLVVKNAVLNVVLDKLKLKDVKPMVEGGVGISFSGEDIISTSKLLVGFAKGNDKFKIRGAFIDGKLVSADKIKELAMLPARDVLLAMVVGGIKSPITGFVNVLSGVIRKFVYAIDAIKVSKEKGAPAQSAPETAGT